MAGTKQRPMVADDGSNCGDLLAARKRQVIPALALVASIYLVVHAVRLKAPFAAVVVIRHCSVPFSWASEHLPRQFLTIRQQRNCCRS